ncbi:hypothetical protein BGW38_009386 [Lunasporangiospora selenospora]|uniref:Major Facilitator Superfamily protein n=1 Tax=Lunasporangiospora selenospora TaxID=979761 RepID=A0A9P6FXR8_9FUNG|nr:hypothetical protein BGW38_009386 [Lunasporangiospora selenospora]
MGKALIGYTLGLMSGPPLGGLLYERGGYRAPFIFCGAITLLDFICRAFIIEEREEIVNALREQGMSNEAMEEEAQVVARRKQERQETSSSFRNLLKSKRLIGCVLVTACNAFVFSGAEPTVPLHLASKFDLSSEKIGLVFMAFSLPTITSPLSAILTPILGEISAVVRSTGTGDGFARAYAMFNMAFSVGVLVGPVVCGLIYEHFGFWAICLTMSGVLFLVTPVVILWIGGIDQKRQDLAKYKEEEKAKQSTQSASSRSLLAHSKYSIEFHQEQSLELGTRGGTSTLDLDQQRDNGN